MAPKVYRVTAFDNCVYAGIPGIISVVAALNNGNVTHFAATPPVYSRLLLHYQARLREELPQSLRVCFTAGEHMPANLLANWEKDTNALLVNTVGSSELLHFLTNNAGMLRILISLKSRRLSNY